MLLLVYGFILVVPHSILFGAGVLEDFDYSKVVPEDVLEEVLEAEERGVSGGRVGRERFPSSRDIVEAVIEAVGRAAGVHPDDFPDLVYSVLRERGFSTRFVTVKRIWRVYENLVRRGVVRDVLGVVAYAGEEEG